MISSAMMLYVGIAGVVAWCVFEMEYYGVEKVRNSSSGSRWWWLLIASFEHSSLRGRGRGVPGVT